MKLYILLIISIGFMISLRLCYKTTMNKVYTQLKRTYPEYSMAWVKTTEWTGPIEIPFSSVDISKQSKWRSSYEPKIVKEKMQDIKNGFIKPIILIKIPGKTKYKIIDGHHRTIAYEQLNLPMTAYIGSVPSQHGEWDTFHSTQLIKNVRV